MRQTGSDRISYALPLLAAELELSAHSDARISSAIKVAIRLSSNPIVRLDAIFAFLATRGVFHVSTLMKQYLILPSAHVRLRVRPSQCLPKGHGGVGRPEHQCERHKRDDLLHAITLSNILTPFGERGLDPRPPPTQ